MLALVFVSLPAPLFAAITLTFQPVPGDRMLVGRGTPIAILEFGSVSAFEPVGSGVTRTTNASSYTLSAPFGIRVSKHQTQSNSYTLQARLLGAHALAWQIDGVSMTTSPATIATAQQYNRTVPHTVGFTIPYAHPAGLVTATLEVIAIAN